MRLAHLLLIFLLLRFLLLLLLLYLQTYLATRVSMFNHFLTYVPSSSITITAKGTNEKQEIRTPTQRGAEAAEAALEVSVGTVSSRGVSLDILWGVWALCLALELSVGIVFSPGGE